MTACFGEAVGASFGVGILNVVTCCKVCAEALKVGVSVCARACVFMFARARICRLFRLFECGELVAFVGFCKFCLRFQFGTLLGFLS